MILKATGAECWEVTAVARVWLSTLGRLNSRDSYWLLALARNMKQFHLILLHDFKICVRLDFD
jgi:hypothetical protein